MELNSIIFPAPRSSYTEEDLKGELVWIPRKTDFSYKDQIKYSGFKSLIPHQKNRIIKENGIIQKVPKLTFSLDNKFVAESLPVDHYIPCLFIKAASSSNIILYFHANYEDLGQTRAFLQNLGNSLQINILAVEYPGYGLYSGVICDADKIVDDASIIYKFLTNVMCFKEDNMIIMGRCIGSGPGTYLASKHNPKALVLISPFTSIKDAVKTIFANSLLGWLAEKLVSERFKIIDLIDKIVCPTLFIHGKSDRVIPWKHSLTLMEKCKCPAKLVTPEKMEHNYFNTKIDIVTNMKEFFTNILPDETIEKEEIEDFSADESEKISNKIHFPIFMFKNPKSI